MRWLASMRGVFCEVIDGMFGFCALVCEKIGMGLIEKD